MKRLAALAVVVALSALPAWSQHGGGHGGFSGGHGGFSGSHGGGFSGFHGGFSGSHGGFSGFHSGSGSFSHGGFGGFRGSTSNRFFAPTLGRFAGAFDRFPASGFGGSMSGRFAGASRYASNPSTHAGLPYGGPRLRPFGPRGGNPWAPGTMHRMPYDGRHGGNGWNHGGGHGRRGDRRHRYRDDDDDFGFYGFDSFAGYPFLPWWSWGYPDLFDNCDAWDGNCDSGGDNQPADNSASSAAQYPEYPPDQEYAPGPYDQPPPDAPAPPQPSYAPWPYSKPAPSTPPVTVTSPPAPETPLTLVFKDGRPNEQIHNYLLTDRMLLVLDQRKRDIPVDQIDLAATAKVNRAAGIDFQLPTEAP